MTSWPENITLALFHSTDLSNLNHKTIVVGMHAHEVRMPVGEKFWRPAGHRPSVRRKSRDESGKKEILGSGSAVIQCPKIHSDDSWHFLAAAAYAFNRHTRMPATVLHGENAGCDRERN